KTDPTGYCSYAFINTYCTSTSLPCIVDIVASCLMIHHVITFPFSGFEGSSPTSAASSFSLVTTRGFVLSEQATKPAASTAPSKQISLTLTADLQSAPCTHNHSWPSERGSSCIHFENLHLSRKASDLPPATVQ